MMGWILSGIAAFILLLALVPFIITVTYEKSGFSLTLRYLFFTFPLFLTGEEGAENSRKREKRGSPDSKKSKQKKPSKNVSKEKISLFDMLSLINDLLPNIGKELKYILNRTSLYRFRLTLGFSGKDAAEAAISCGRANAVLYSMYAPLSNILKVKEWNLCIYPDFLAEEDRQELLAKLRVKPLTLLLGGGRLILRSGMMYLSVKPRNSSPDKSQVSKKAV